jgi:hypothetical protein
MLSEETVHVKRSQQHGIALVELSAWLVVLLPLLMIAASLFATTHDHRLIQMIPESLMRETGGRVVTWNPRRTGGVFEVDESRVRAITAALANRAQSEVTTSTFKLLRPAVRACYWVYEINPRNGNPGVIRRQGCEERNDPRGALATSLERARDWRVQTGIAEPIRIAAGLPQEFVSQAVLLGVSVGGEFGGFEGLYEPRIVQHAAAWVPRRDVGL